MLKIRLHRTGKKRRPYFRVVVVEHTQAAQGPYLRSLGFWDPIKHKLTLNKEELTTWLSRGARPTDRISRLLKKEGIKHKLIVIHERPARGPKKLEPKPEPAKVAVSEQTHVEVEPPKEPVEVSTEEKPAAPVAEASLDEAKAKPQIIKEPKPPKEVKAEPVESAAKVSKSEKKGR